MCRSKQPFSSPSSGYKNPNLRTLRWNFGIYQTEWYRQMRPKGVELNTLISESSSPGKLRFWDRKTCRCEMGMLKLSVINRRKRATFALGGSGIMQTRAFTNTNDYTNKTSGRTLETWGSCPLSLSTACEMCVTSDRYAGIRFLSLPLVGNGGEGKMGSALLGKSPNKPITPFPVLVGYLF